MGLNIKYGIGELVVLTNEENTQYLLVKVGWVTTTNFRSLDSIKYTSLDSIKYSYHAIVKKASKELCAGIINSNLIFSDKSPWRPISIDKDSIKWEYTDIDNPDVVD